MRKRPREGSCRPQSASSQRPERAPHAAPRAGELHSTPNAPSPRLPSTPHRPTPTATRSPCRPSAAGPPAQAHTPSHKGDALTRRHAPLHALSGVVRDAKLTSSADRKRGAVEGARGAGHTSSCIAHLSPPVVAVFCNCRRQHTQRSESGRRSAPPQAAPSRQALSSAPKTRSSIPDRPPHALEATAHTTSATPARRCNPTPIS